MKPSLRSGILGLVVGAPLVLAAPAALAHDEVFIGTLSALGEPTQLDPPSLGTGTVRVTINEDTLSMRVEATFSALTGTTTAAHIHCCTPSASSGSAGVATQTPTFVGFPLGVQAGSMDQSFDMTLAASWNPAFVTANGGSIADTFAAFTTGVKDGKAYFNIHTSAVPGGEVRAFLVAAPVPEPETYALMLAGLGLVGWAASRRRKQ
jgi:hypothetical protein